MGISSLIKYSLRFLFLQIVLTYFTIFYFNTYLLSDLTCEQCIGYSFAMQIDANLWEDRNRFFPFLSEQLVTINIFLGVFVFLFLVILYSTKFYTYVNELSYSLDRSYIDEYISIYLLWTSSLFVFLTFFRVAHLISRGYLVLFTFIVPILLLMFRNSEFISSLLGRSVTNENYITFNLEKDSLFRNLRIMTFRKPVKDFVEKAAPYFGFNIEWRGEGKDEFGFDLVSGSSVIRTHERYFRPAEVESLLGDSTKAKEKLGWEPTTTFDELIEDMCIYGQ